MPHSETSAWTTYLLSGLCGKLIWYLVKDPWARFGIKMSCPFEIENQASGRILPQSTAGCITISLPTYLGWLGLWMAFLVGGWRTGPLVSLATLKSLKVLNSDDVANDSRRLCGDSSSRRSEWLVRGFWFPKSISVTPDFVRSWIPDRLSLIRQPAIAPRIIKLSLTFHTGKGIVGCVARIQYHVLWRFIWKRKRSHRLIILIWILSQNVQMDSWNSVLRPFLKPSKSFSTMTRIFVRSFVLAKDNQTFAILAPWVWWANPKVSKNECDKV